MLLSSDPPGGVADLLRGRGLSGGGGGGGGDPEEEPQDPWRDPYNLRWKYVAECFSLPGARKMVGIVMTAMRPSSQRILNKGSSLLLLYIVVTLAFTAAENLSSFLSVMFGVQGFSG